jgi:hypothetical protein
MQYNPDAKKPSTVLPAGEYPAQIVHAEEKNSKAGNPMLVVKMAVWNTVTANEYRLTDYIIQGGQYSADWKIKNLARAAGLEVSGDLDPMELIGKNVKVKLRVKPPKDNFPESNGVSDYFPWQTDKDGPQPEPKPQQPVDADIPF